jgi:hypothetical protein
MASSSRPVSTATGISGCFYPGQAEVVLGPTPLAYTMQNSEVWFLSQTNYVVGDAELSTWESTWDGEEANTTSAEGILILLNQVNLTKNNKRNRNVFVSFL